MMHLTSRVCMLYRVISETVFFLNFYLVAKLLIFYFYCYNVRLLVELQVVKMLRKFLFARQVINSNSHIVEH